mgnify:FL=1
MLSWETMTTRQTTNNDQRADVLVVEDESLVNEMICWSLEELGYRVIARAYTGTKGIELTESQKPDVIILDISLPDMHGIEVIRRIHETHPTPVVVLTAHETLELVRQAGRAGAGAYLIKPASGQQIERAITIAMAEFDRFNRLQERIDTLENKLSNSQARY